MTLKEKLIERGAIVAPFASAIRLNARATLRVWRRGHQGWTGAVNTDYEPLDRSTAAQPYDAYRAPHRQGRVHYNPKFATWILCRHEEVRAALRDTYAVISTEGVLRMKISAVRGP